MAKQKISPARGISGGVSVPGDKSISHRYAILAALAEGTSEIHNFSTAADCQSTLECLERLGVAVHRDRETVRITGAGLDGLRRSWRALDAANSGTTMRLLAGVLAGQPFASKLTGDASLRRRPMRRVIEPLTRMGAEIRARAGGFAPLEIRGGRLRPIEYELPVASAQVKSAVLLAGLFAEGVTRVTEPVPTRDHTELALGEFGAEIERAGKTICVHGRVGDGVPGRPALKARTFTVPGDLSAGVFFLAAGLLMPGSSVLLHNVGLNPTRTAVLDVLAQWGAALRLLNVRGPGGELAGDIAVEPGPLRGGEISGPLVAQVIDELPMLAALGPFTEQGVHIRDAQELRVKESDRIAALAENLRRMGAQVEERPDGLSIAGRGAGKLHGAEIKPRGDHRIAMAFAIAALAAEGESVIREAECAGVSFPEFFATLQSLAKV